MGGTKGSQMEVGVVVGSELGIVVGVMLVALEQCLEWQEGCGYHVGKEGVL